MTKQYNEPHGELTIRTLAMPANTNTNGDIFGGWIVANMDLAGLSLAEKTANSRAVTAAIDKMVFLSPVKVGDFICCYADLLKIGRTSMTIEVQTWAVGRDDSKRHQVTSGVFTYVAIDQAGKPIEVKRST